MYCDGNQLPGSPGFQRAHGSPGNLRWKSNLKIQNLCRDFVAFDAFLRSPVEDNYRYIGFTDTLVNIGEGFLTKDGIFKVQSPKMTITVGLLPGSSDRNLSVQRTCPSCEEQAIQRPVTQEQVRKTT